MNTRPLLAAVLGCAPVLAQATCEGTPVYTPCELVFPLTGQEAAANPNPYVSIDFRGEFRSPDHRTTLVRAYWDGGTRMVMRFTPTEPGAWDYRLSGDLKAFDGKTGSFTIAPSDLPGFVIPRNVHHWAWKRVYQVDVSPHLWMGDTALDFGGMDEAAFRSLVDARADQKFTHMGGLVLGSKPEQAFSAPDKPNPAWFQRLDDRIKYLNSKGLVVDLMLAGPDNELTRLFPTREQRQQYVRYVVSRYAPFNITWLGVEDFESYKDGRALLKEVGAQIKDEDPYEHPRSTGTRATSAPLLDDGWMNFVCYHTSQDALGAIEHQLYTVPFVNLDFGAEGAVDDNTFRHALWNSTMDGEYPTHNSTSPAMAQTAGAQQMKVWAEFFAGNRHWELEPYFDVDGGRAVALDGVEYIVYVQKPGPVEVLVEKHGYDVAWINPLTGERLKQKNYKGEHFTGEPPDSSHDWVLHISREGTKEGMLRSYKFESRRIEMQIIEQAAAKIPFQIAQPAQDTLAIGSQAQYDSKISRPTHATRTMMWLWTGEVASGGKGYRVLGTGPRGEFRVPADLARNFPAVLNLRLYGMNAVGKVYALDKTYQLSR